MKTRISNFDVIQASKDSLVNLSAFAQIMDYKKKNPNTPDTKNFYLQRTTGNANTNAIAEIRNGLEYIGTKSENIDPIINMLGTIPAFKLYPANPDKLGSFNEADTTKSVTKIFNAASEGTQAVMNSLVEGVPFTFGINLQNTRLSQPEKSSFDFLTDGYLGVPTGATLFGSAEILNLIDFKGQPTDITNGATDIATTAVRGSQELVQYKIFGIQIPELTNEISPTGNGYAGDNLIKSVFANSLQITEAKMKTAIMRSFYSDLTNLKGADGKPLIPSYTLNDIDTAFNGKKLKDLFSTSAGVGEFLTKILPRLWSPGNKFLDANQNILKRIVAPTSLTGAIEQTIATLGFQGQTTGQVPTNDNLANMLRNIKFYYGGDILPEIDSSDIRILCVADPKFSEFDRQEYSSLWVSMALAPTIMATSTHIGFTNQVFVSKFSEPYVPFAKRLMFLS